MRTIPYKEFSFKVHRKSFLNYRPGVCQFELTFKCGLRCRHCYSDCYNNPKDIRKELNTAGVKAILDQVFLLGALWLCFTGGDPLARADFLKVYAYAKDKGFIATIFTSGYYMNKEIARYLKVRPPFAIEMTLNAVTPDLYERISGVRGSFSRIMKGIDFILKAGLPLKIKTLVLKENLGDIPKIRKFLRERGLKFNPSVVIHGRLNHDPSPCDSRISPGDCFNSRQNRKAHLRDCEADLSGSRRRRIRNRFFPCSISGGSGLYIDPYGNLVPCRCIRRPAVSLLEAKLGAAHQRILDWVSKMDVRGNSACRNCSIKKFCFNCPGKALLETHSLKEKVDWFCQFAHIKAGSFC